MRVYELIDEWDGRVAFYETPGDAIIEGKRRLGEDAKSRNIGAYKWRVKGYIGEVLVIGREVHTHEECSKGNNVDVSC